MAEGKSFAEWTGEEIARLDERVDAQSTPQMNGAVIDRLYLSDGQGGIAGALSAGSGVVVRDYTQPTPTAPVLEEQSEVGVIEVRWDGLSAELVDGYPHTYYFWDGPPHASFSIKSMVDAAPVWNFLTNPSFENGVDGWHNGHGGDLQAVPRGDLFPDHDGGLLAGRITIAELDDFGSFVSSDPLPVTPGQWVSAASLIAVAAEGVGAQYRLGIQYNYTDTTSEIVGTWSNLAAAPTGARVTMSREIPDNVETVQLVLEVDRANATGTFEVYADNTMLALAATQADALDAVDVYFDGDTPDDEQRKRVPQGAAFGRVQTRHRLIEGGVQPDPEGPDWREGGGITTYAGGTTTVSLGIPGTHAVWFYMIGPNNVERSYFSEPLIVEVEPLVDAEEIQQWIDDKAQELEETIEDHGNREGTEPPEGIVAPEGVVYYQKTVEGLVVGIWQSQGNGSWVGMPLNHEVLASVTTDKLVAGESLIDGVLIKDGAITLSKMTVTEEMMVALLNVKKIEAGDIAANAIDGMRITGALIIGGRVATSETGFRVEMQNDAVTAYNSSNQIQARYSGDGIELRPPGGALTPIGPHIFGSQYIEWPALHTYDGSSGWSSWVNNTQGGSFPVVSPRYKVEIIFQLDIAGVYSNVNPRLQMTMNLTGNGFSRAVISQHTFYFINVPPNTPFTYTAFAINTSPFLESQLGQNVSLQRRLRMANLFGVTIRDFKAIVTPV